MYYSKTTATQKIASLTKKIRIVQGGTSASKTISNLLYLIAMAQTDTEKTLASVVAESTPHLKRGALRDFKNIMQGHNYWKDARWNATDSIYTFETGSQIEFFSADQPDKLRGARRDRCFMNEANNMELETFDQLEVRTKEFMLLDYNPTNEFWVHTEILPNRTDAELIILTYKDNEALSKEIVDSIEQRKGRKQWWRVYGEGQLGEVEGKIYKGWIQIDEIPHEARLERRGLDYGYTNDPTAIVDIYYWNGAYILDEVTYQKGLSNKQIADILKNQEQQVLVVPDSAEPKSNDELISYGINVLPATKGQGSVNYGIQILQNQRIFVTKRSRNIWREYSNYLWETDKNGKILNTPEGGFDHCFAPNSLVYTTNGIIPIRNLVGKEGYLYSRDGKIERFYNVRPTRTNAEIIDIEFCDGNILSVTPDHLLLLPNGEWKEAGLLCPLDMIQSGMYEQNIYLQWFQIYKVFIRKVLQRACQWSIKMATQICMGNREGRDTKRLSHSSQRPRQGKQHNRQFRNCSQVNSSLKSHDARKEREAETLGRKNKTTNKEVAWVKRGNRVAQVTWAENIPEKRSYFKKLLTLPQDLHNKALRKVCKILQSELQNESKTKTVKGITRGFSTVTYNMEVENTHCLLVDGVIAHNSMDAVRYGIETLNIDTGLSDIEKYRLAQARRNGLTNYSR